MPCSRSDATSWTVTTVGTGTRHGTSVSAAQYTSGRAAANQRATKPLRHTVPPRTRQTTSRVPGIAATGRRVFASSVTRTP